jgi:hypothetical protein
MGCLRCEVKACLDALCEGVGVTEAEDGDFEVDLDALPIWVRCQEQPPAVTLFCTLGADMAFTPEVADAMNTFNRCTRIFRSFFEEGSVVLRADLSASPLSAMQLQFVLESFEQQAEALNRVISDVS